MRDRVFAASDGKCVYCGGFTEATTIDHMPPKIVFRGKDRPRGFEFASCAPCNNGASHSDLVAAMYCRSFPDIEQSEFAEMRSIFKAVGNNIPGLLEEMYVQPERGAKVAADHGLSGAEDYLIAMDGPIAMKYMRAFGARMAYAMHFQNTGQIVPPEGGAVARIYSNLDIHAGRIPPDLISFLPEPVTLKAGIKHVGSQFRISTRAAVGDGMTLTLAAFRFSFAIMAIAADDVGKLIDPSFPPAAQPIRPGEIQRF